MSVSREICKICGDINRVGFSVPDEVWSEVVPLKWRSSIVCLRCFTRLADEKLVEWDKCIDFYPVSMKSHLNWVEEEDK